MKLISAQLQLLSHPTDSCQSCQLFDRQLSQVLDPPQEFFCSLSYKALARSCRYKVLGLLGYCYLHQYHSHGRLHKPPWSHPRFHSLLGFLGCFSAVSQHYLPTLHRRLAGNRTVGSRLLRCWRPKRDPIDYDAHVSPSELWGINTPLAHTLQPMLSFPSLLFIFKPALAIVL